MKLLYNNVSAAINKALKFIPAENHTISFIRLVFQVDISLKPPLYKL